MRGFRGAMMGRSSKGGAVHVAKVLPAALLALPACILGHGTGTLELQGLPDAPPRRVAVVPFTGADSYPRVTADWVAFRLSETGVAVVSAEQTDIAFREAKFTWSAADGPTPETVRAAAALLRADVLVDGTTARSGRGPAQVPEFSVVLRAWNGATGELAGTATAYTGFVMASSDYAVMAQAAEHAADCVVRALGAGPSSPAGGN